MVATADARSHVSRGAARGAEAEHAACNQQTHSDGAHSSCDVADSPYAAASPGAQISSRHARQCHKLDGDSGDSDDCSSDPVEVVAGVALSLASIWPQKMKDNLVCSGVLREVLFVRAGGTLNPAEVAACPEPRRGGDQLSALLSSGWL